MCVFVLLFLAKITEETTASVDLVTVLATDLDIGINAKITYSLVNDHNGVFKIDSQSGLLRSVQPIDYEKVQSFVLDIKAADWKFENLVQVTITVININDNDPIFEPKEYQKTIPEDEAINALVLTATATDKDPFGDLVYSIVASQTQLPFQINSRTGKISVSGQLDRETKAEYRFNIRATDSGNPTRSGDANIVITLSDINDNDPKFTSYSISTSVRENTKAGVTVHTAKATDIDFGNNAKIRYRVKPGQNDKEFEIGETSGEVKTKKVFDREKQTETRFVLQAYDLGNPSRTSADVVITVKILDENDNTPAWAESDLKVSIPEHTSTGTQIRTVTATDPDEGENGRISYSIEEKNAPVAINMDTGRVSIKLQAQRWRVMACL